MDCKWVFGMKWDGDGNWLRDKARLVGKGYTQQYGLDYNDTWAAVTRLESVRMSAAVAAKLDLVLWQVDFVSAYLNSETKEDIYMRQPPGYVVEGRRGARGEGVQTRPYYLRNHAGRPRLVRNTWEDVRGPWLPRIEGRSLRQDDWPAWW